MSIDTKLSPIVEDEVPAVSVSAGAIDTREPVVSKEKQKVIVRRNSKKIVGFKDYRKDCAII